MKTSQMGDFETDPRRARVAGAREDSRARSRTAERAKMATEDDVELPEAGTEPTKASGKRKQRVNPGQHCCWWPDCDARGEVCKPCPKERVQDAQFGLEVHLGYDPMAGVSAGKPRLLPDKHNKLCPQHFPVLPEQRILGATVLLEEDGQLVPATVEAPVAGRRRVAAGAALSAVAVIRQQKWMARTEAGVAHELSTADVWRCAGLFKVHKEGLARQKAENAKKVQSLQTMLARARNAQKESQKEASGDAPHSPNRPQPPPGPPPAARSPRSASGRRPSGRASASSVQLSEKRVLLRVRVPDGWEDGQQISFCVPTPPNRVRCSRPHCTHTSEHEFEYTLYYIHRQG